MACGAGEKVDETIALFFSFLGSTERANCEEKNTQTRIYQDEGRPFCQWAEQRAYHLSQKQHNDCREYYN